MLLQQRQPGAAEEYHADDHPGHWVPSVVGEPGKPPTVREWRFGLRWLFSRIAQ